MAVQMAGQALRYSDCVTVSTAVAAQSDLRGTSARCVVALERAWWPCLSAAISRGAVATLAAFVTLGAPMQPNDGTAVLSGTARAG